MASDRGDCDGGRREGGEGRGTTPRQRLDDGESESSRQVCDIEEAESQSERRKERRAQAHDTVGWNARQTRRARVLPLALA